MALADIQMKSTVTSNGQPARTGLAATLREAGPGVTVRFQLADGDEVSGAMGDVQGDRVRLEGVRRQIDLRQVRRVCLEFSEAPKPKRRRRAHR